ncbi:hypothetical protein [Thalassospira lucentensis]|uniref:hypothetical protein n=1 Tax=Thalassospira lucentensis TaxID=168935 RepID=UPI003AA86E8C
MNPNTLSDAEKFVLSKISDGQLARFADDDETVFPGNPVTWNAKHTIRAEFLTALITNKFHDVTIPHNGVWIHSVRIVGELNWEGIKIDYPIGLIACRVEEVFLLRDAQTTRLNFHQSYFKGILADRIKSKSSLAFRQSTFGEAGLNLSEARVDGEIDLDGSTYQGIDYIHQSVEGNALEYGIVHPLPISIQASGAKLSGTFRIRNVNLRGIIALNGVDIDGDLEVTNTNFQVTHPNVFFLQTANIGRAFIWRNITFSNSCGVVFSHTTVNQLLDQEDSWPDGILMDSFTFKELAGDAPRTAESRLKWLNKQDPSGIFFPQTFEVLSKYYRSIGDKSSATKIVGAKFKRLQSQPTTPTHEKILISLFGLLSSYGYSPVRPLVAIMLFWLAGWSVFSLANFLDIIVPAYPFSNIGTNLEFSAAWFSADLLIPFIDIGDASRWNISTYTWIGYCFKILSFIQTLSGWALATLAAATVTGVIQSD